MSGDRPLFVRLSLPSGLEESLESLAREVLRKQPKNIYEFAAAHFEDQLRKRNLDQGLPEERDLTFFSLDLSEVKNGHANDVTELDSRSGHEPDETNVIDIDLDDPDVEAAATKIQAGFRGSKDRQRVKSLKVEKEEDHKNEEMDTAATGEEELLIPVETSDPPKKAIEIQMPSQIMMEDDDAMDENKESENEEIDIDLEDPDVEKAATKIQAGYKGMKTRKKLKEDKDEGPMEEREEADPANDNEHRSEDIDIDLNDPEVAEAATKIQAGYKGHLARKEVKQRKEILEDRKKVPKSLDEMNRRLEDEIIDIDLSDPQTEKAATTIQAGYRGMKTRKEMGHKPKEGPDTQSDSIDIDLDDPDVAEAATKIQAGYKGYRTRKGMKSNSQKQEIEMTEDEAATKIQAGFKGFHTRRNMQNASASTLNEDEDMEMAATKIQAGYRGMKTRKDMKAKSNGTVQVEEEAIDIDLTDPEVQEAASKIQAGYKGFKTRRELQKDQDSAEVAAEAGNLADDEDGEGVIDIDIEDPEVALAATKIQAGYRGMKTRRDLVQREDKEAVIDPEDPQVVQAATTIQAGYRGMKTRKEVENKLKINDEEVTKTEAGEEEVVDIDLEDPEVQQAAMKIKAGFKGHMARKGAKKEVQDVVVKDDEQILDDIEQDLLDPEMEMAATKIQAGYKGMKARKEVAEKRASAMDNDSLTVISEVDTKMRHIEDSGAVPFAQEAPVDDPLQDEDDGEEKLKKGDITEGGLVLGDADVEDTTFAFSDHKDASLASSLDKSKHSNDPMIFHYRGSCSSQKVLIYLYERKIEFTARNVDLKQNEHLSHWFLKLNPKGEVPVMKLGDDTVADSTRIIHTLEEKFPQNEHHPALVPVSSDTKTYQLYVYFIALLDQIPLNQITQGLSFHPSLPLSSMDARGSFFADESSLDEMKTIVESRPAVLRQAAEDCSEDNETAASALRSKAEQEESVVLPKLKEVASYEEILDQAATTLDKIEEHLATTNGEFNSDECPMVWLLGPSLSACDIALGVVLNRLALLGLQSRFWLGFDKPRKHVHKFLKAIQRRPSFSKAVAELGNPDGEGPIRGLAQDLAVSAGDVGAAPGSTNDSIDVWNEIKKGMSEEGDDKHDDERTWKSLW